MDFWYFVEVTGKKFNFCNKFTLALVHATLMPACACNVHICIPHCWIVRTILPTCWFVFYQLLKNTFVHQLPHAWWNLLIAILYQLIVPMKNLYYLLGIFIIRCYCNVYFICLSLYCFVLYSFVLSYSCCIHVCSSREEQLADYCESKLKIESFIKQVEKHLKVVKDECSH